METQSKNSAYSQFIYGKLVKYGQQGTTSGYQLVGHTQDLAAQKDQLEQLANEYRFWGSQPPVHGKSQAVGIFPHKQYLVVVQATSAKDNTGRFFSQHRYVLMPLKQLIDLRGHLIDLCTWVFSHPIEIHSQFQTNLEPFPALPSEKLTTITLDAEVKKLQQGLQALDNQSQALPFSLVAALINHPRLRILIDQSDANVNDAINLLQHIIYLLPLSCRYQLSLALGTLDENSCTWAKLMIKGNSSGKTTLENLLWINLKTKRIVNEVGTINITSAYTDRLQQLDYNTETLTRLINTLDESVSCTDLTTLNQPVVISHFILLLPIQKRVKAWQNILPQLNPTGFENIISIITDITDKQTIWEFLLSNFDQNPAFYTPICQLWPKFSVDIQVDLMERTLPQHLELADKLVKDEILAQPVNHHKFFLNALFNLKTAIIDFFKKKGSPIKNLIDEIKQDKHFQTASDQFILLDSLINQETDEGTLYNLLNNNMSSLIPHIELDIYNNSNLLKQLKEKLPYIATSLKKIIIDKNRTLHNLPTLTRQMQMENKDRIAFYSAILNTWKPTNNEMLPLLVDLLKRGTPIFIEESSWSSALGTVNNWLQTHWSQANTVLANLEKASTWKNWQSLATTFYPDNILQQLQFLEEMTGDAFFKQLLHQWLQLLTDKLYLDAFKNSITWQKTEQDLPELASALALLLGFIPFSTEKLFNSIQQIKQTLVDLPETTIFGFLEQLPNHHGLENFSVGDLTEILTIYLHHNYVLDTEKSHLWFLLNRQSSHLAQFFSNLQNNKATPKALIALLDRFKERKHLLALTNWILLSNQKELISGPLLDALLFNQKQTLEPELLQQLITRPITTYFNVEDWFAITRFYWQNPATHPHPSGNIPILTESQQQELKYHANQTIKTYTTPTQTQVLLADCQKWGLTQQDLADIIGHALPSACSITLLNQYIQLFNDPNPTFPHPFLNFVLQIPTQSTQEKNYLTIFLSQQFKQFLKQPEKDLHHLKQWRNQAEDQEIFFEALAQATNQLTDTHLNQLFDIAKQLHHIQLINESECIGKEIKVYCGMQFEQLEL